MMSSAFKLNSKQFMSGLWQGMAGVATLYSPVSMPSPIEVNIPPIRTPILEPMEALRSDWVTTGMDIDAAVKKYGEITQA